MRDQYDLLILFYFFYCLYKTVINILRSQIIFWLINDNRRNIFIVTQNQIQKNRSFPTCTKAFKIFTVLCFYLIDSLSFPEKS